MGGKIATLVLEIDIRERWFVFESDDYCEPIWNDSNQGHRSAINTSYDDTKGLKR